MFTCRPASGWTKIEGKLSMADGGWPIIPHRCMCCRILDESQARENSIQLVWFFCILNKGRQDCCCWENGTVFFFLSNIWIRVEPSVISWLPIRNRLACRRWLKPLSRDREQMWASVSWAVADTANDKLQIRMNTVKIVYCWSSMESYLMVRIVLTTHSAQ